MQSSFMILFNSFSSEIASLKFRKLIKNQPTVIVLQKRKNAIFSGDIVARRQLALMAVVVKSEISECGCVLESLAAHDAVN